MGNEKEIVPTNVKMKESLIKVIGVGGGGCNAVSQMYLRGITDVDMAVCNTDLQSLRSYPVPEKIQLGPVLTGGLGAGCEPTQGQNAALESIDQIKASLSGSIRMVFITAGMGGGTGTGAAPVLAKVAREMGLLSVAVVTQPSDDEGHDMITRAYLGIQELSKYVDSLLIINNQKIYEFYNALVIKDAFSKSDDVLCTAVRGIAEIITGRGYINVDFADVSRVMKNSGVAILGIGEAQGKDRAGIAVETAFNSPLLNDYDLRTAKSVLVNISSNTDPKLGLTAAELKEIMSYIKEYTGAASNFKRGVVYDDNLPSDGIRVTVVATGFKMNLNTGPGNNFDEENTVMLDMTEESGSIMLPIPEDTEITMESSKIVKSTEGIPFFTKDCSITDWENEPAIKRKRRLAVEKAEAEKQALLQKEEEMNLTEKDISLTTEQ
ncbi:MAG: cell division protein FtsZ [Alistipes sp.]|nr:cell division protein FtsZ [Candidatus Minthomonas equi]